MLDAVIAIIAGLFCLLWVSAIEDGVIGYGHQERAFDVLEKELETAGFTPCPEERKALRQLVAELASAPEISCNVDRLRCRRTAHGDYYAFRSNWLVSTGESLDSAQRLAFLYSLPHQSQEPVRIFLAGPDCETPVNGGRQLPMYSIFGTVVYVKTHYGVRKLRREAGIVPVEIPDDLVRLGVGAVFAPPDIPLTTLFEPGALEGCL